MIATAKRFLLRHIRNTTAIGVTILFCTGYLFLWSSGADSDRHLADALVAYYFISWALYAFLSKCPRQEIQKRFLLTCATLAVCIGLIEVPGAVRLVDYRMAFSSPGHPSWWNTPTYIEDRELIWIHTPHFHWKGRYVRGNIGDALCGLADEPRDFEVKYDWNGFRNDSDLTSADIAVIGDSIVESPQTPSNALMTTVLGQLGNSTVVNLGVSGYGPQQELIVLDRYALPLHPKTIAWVFYEGNDLGDVQRYQENLQQLAKPQHRPSLLGRLWDRSFTKNLLGAVLRVHKGCAPAPSASDYFATFKDASGNEVRQYFLADLYKDIGGGKESEAMGAVRSSLAIASHLAQTQGIRFVLVFAPTEFRVLSGLPNVTRISEKAQQWDVDDLPQRLRSAVSDISPKIDFLDLTSAFRTETEKGNRMFLPDDTHWTNEGHRIAAHVFHELLTDGMPAKTEPQPGAPNKQEIVPNSQHDAMMVRDGDGTIRYWNKAAQDLYGWTPQEALGKRSHSLLKTHFPTPLTTIENEVASNKHWKGKLVHTRRDGSKIIVSSRWDLQQNPMDLSMTIVEMNRTDNL